MRQALLARADGATLAHSIDSDIGLKDALALLIRAHDTTPADPLIDYLYARRLAAMGDEAQALTRLPATPPDYLAFETQRLRVEWMIDLRERVGLSDAAQRLTERAEQSSQAQAGEISAAAAAAARANFYLRHGTW